MQKKKEKVKMWVVSRPVDLVQLYPGSVTEREYKENEIFNLEGWMGSKMLK